MKHSLYTRTILYLVISLLPVIDIFAAPRSEKQALQIAQDFFPEIINFNSANSRKVLSDTKADNLSNEAFYIFNNADGQGFVIISADDRMPKILAYSYDHSFPTTDLPEHIKHYLATYDESLRLLNEGESTQEEIFPVIATTQNTFPDKIEPLLGKIEFGQAEPYNYYTPYDNRSKCPSGCVATAMAQIMKYYEYPAVGTGSFSVQGTNYDLSKRPFKWDLILDSYKGVSATEEQKEAVGNLLIACGAAVGMSYKASGSSSGGQDMFNAMKNNFDYNCDKLVSVSNGEQQNWYFDWIRNMVKQIANKQPIYFDGGSGMVAGHAFVIDGYEILKPWDDNDARSWGNIEVEDVYFHVNWGWDGYSNGFYYLNSLKPRDTSNIDAPEAKYDFSSFQNSWTSNLRPKIWTALEDAQLTRQIVNSNDNIYDILGQKVNPNNLQTNTIYIQNGQKFILR